MGDLGLLNMQGLYFCTRSYIYSVTRESMVYVCVCACVGVVTYTLYSGVNSHCKETSRVYSKAKLMSKQRQADRQRAMDS